MAENEDLSDETLDEAESQLAPDHPVLKALRSEREKRKAAERQVAEATERAEQVAKFGELKSRFPWLKETHFKGRDLDEWETWATELDELRGEQKGEAGPETPEAEASVTHPEEQVLANAQQLDKGRTGEPKAPLAEVGALELDRKYRDGELSEADYAAELTRRYSPQKVG